MVMGGLRWAGAHPLCADIIFWWERERGDTEYAQLGRILDGFSLLFASVVVILS